MTIHAGARPRLVPDAPLPPYSFVPGRHPHPVSDPAGHLFGKPPERPAAPDPDRWQESRAFLHGVDLFNHGYYWEAHEAWESLWHACGRSGLAADFLKGLIKLAAAGVKAREGRPEGVRRHARRAHELLEQTRARLGPDVRRYFGLDLAELLAAAAHARGGGAASDAADHAPVRIVFPFQLRPE